MNGLIVAVSLVGINMNSVHFTTLLNMSSHSGGMLTVGYLGKMLSLFSVQFYLYLLKSSV